LTLPTHTKLLDRTVAAYGADQRAVGEARDRALIREIMDLAAAAEAVRCAVDIGMLETVASWASIVPLPARNAHAGRVFEIRDDVVRRHGALEIRFQIHVVVRGPVTFTMIVLAPLGVKLIPLAISRELAEILTMSVDPARSIELEVVLVAGIDRAVRG
jgi:hypothetical protein